jgi:glutathione S-transferase
MSLALYISAPSPFCRKVRMAMEYKGLEFGLATADHVSETPAYNPRAEVPILVDSGSVVCNSSDILAFLDRRYPEQLLYPVDPLAYALVREWERTADTVLDSIVTVISNWRFFPNLPEMPAGLLEAARRDIAPIYDRLQASLGEREYVCGAISAADFALYPQVTSGASLGLPFDVERHAAVRAWLQRMRSRPEGQTDLAATRDWWANKDKSTADTERVNWGTFRLEWLLANGQADWFADQVRRDKVLWSVGPQANSRNSPFEPHANHRPPASSR